MCFFFIVFAVVIFASVDDIVIFVCAVAVLVLLSSIVSAVATFSLQLIALKVKIIERNKPLAY
jgi:hypothetical protein